MSMNTEPIITGLLDVLQAGEYDGKPIKAVKLPKTGELLNNRVHILEAPGFVPEDLGEGFYIAATDWQLILSTELDPNVANGFVLAVIDALHADETLGGVCTGLSVEDIPFPEPREVGASGRQRRIFRREIIVRVHHN